jgi:purine nucleosidase
MTGSPRPILLDTDIGSDVDDALALGFALAEPEALPIVAVTTVSGDARRRARMAARILGLAGRSDLEVAAGEDRALLRDRAFAEVRLAEDTLPEGPDARVVEEPAPERIARAAAEVPGLEIVAIGPLTNVARALALDPGLPRKVGGLTVMGGHVREVRIGDFRCAPGVDYNLCSDPEASVAVLGAGFRTTLVTADVTLRTWMRRVDLARLEAAGPFARAAAAQVRVWEPEQRRIFGGIGGTLDPDNVAFLHDPLTLLALVDESALRFEELRIVTTVERGVLRTIEAPAGAGLGAPMRVATAVDAEVARDAIVDRLARL